MVNGDRVRKHTTDEVQAEIDAEAQRRVASLRGASREALSRRLEELRRAWDVERALEVNASTLILVSSIAAGVRTRSWGFAASAVVAAFLLQHGLQGW